MIDDSNLLVMLVARPRNGRQVVRAGPMHSVAYVPEALESSCGRGIVMSLLQRYVLEA